MKTFSTLLLALLFGCSILLTACGGDESLLKRLGIKEANDLGVLKNKPGDVSAAEKFSGTYRQSAFNGVLEGDCGIYTALYPDGFNIDAGKQAVVSTSGDGTILLNASLLGDFTGALNADGSFTLVSGSYLSSNEYHIEAAFGRFYEDAGIKKAEIEIVIETAAASGAFCRITGKAPLLLTEIQ